MKRIYTLATATALAMTAVAGSGLELRENLDPQKGLTKRHSQPTEQTAVRKAATLPEAATIKSKKAADTGISGEYTITIGDYYSGEQSAGKFNETCQVTLDGNTLTISCDILPSDITGTFADNTITFGNVNLGAFDLQGNTYYMQLQPFEWVWTSDTNGNIEAKPYTATYANSTITFPADHGFMWVAFDNENYSGDGQPALVIDVIGLAKSTGDTDDEGNWTSLGNALFMDGWVLPVFGIDQTDPANHYEVELQQNVNNKNIYRLVDPYHGDSPVAKSNETQKKGHIQFDVTDPDHVVFAAVEAGFAYEELNISKFYCLNHLTILAKNSNVTTNDIIYQYGDKIPYTTFKDGVVSLGSVNGEKGVIYDACFGDHSNNYGGWGWINPETLARVDMTTRITFPEAAINGIAADDTDAPVRYFNLQGIEIAQPAAGQVVIRQQGSNITKIVK